MIRPAVPQDIFRLGDMGRAFFDEAGFAEKVGAVTVELACGEVQSTSLIKLTFDLESFGRTVGTLMDGAGVVLVVEKNGAVVGMAAAGIAPAWWNKNILTAQELFYYCDPDHRKGTGKLLFAALETAVKKRGVVLFSMAAEEGLRSDALTRLYRACGYFPTEKVFWKVLQ